jgi:predicted dienelactone hydrolase
MLHSILLSTLLACPSQAAPLAQERAAYDPLAVESNGEARPTIDLDVVDPARSRTVPVRVWLPEGPGPRPVLLFSHGLGGSRTNNSYLGKHWSARGYAVVCLQHPGSDESVWKDARPRERMTALESAASLENLELRIGDVSAVLDQLERWNRAEGHALFGRFDLARVGMSGHSFGAVTTQAVSGQARPALRPGAQPKPASPREPRVRAAVAMSPSAPTLGDPAAAFGSVALPWMLLTGTRDESPIGRTDPQSRLKVFPALPPGGKYELVLEGAEHSAFSERALPGDARSRNPNHHRAILALTTAFWDAYLLEDAAARAWLDGEGPRSVLEPADRWQRK